MIIGALAFRGALDSEGSGVLGPREPVALVCAAELRGVCDDLAGDDVQVRSEEAGTTAAALTAEAATDADLWLTLAPWPTMVAEARERSGQDALSTASPAVVGRSPLVLVVWQDRAAVLAEACTTDFSWRCVGRLAADPWAAAGGDEAWGGVKPGHGDPTTNATGLLVLGQAVSDYLGSADFSTRDLDDDAFLSWLTSLERAVPNFGSAANTPLQQMLQFGRGRFDIVGTTEAEAGPLLERSAGRAEGLIVRPAAPLVVAEVVLAPLHPDAEGRVDEVVEPAGVALAEAGWQVEGRPVAEGAGVTPLPDDAGTPPPGVLDALRARWEEITR